MSNKTKSQVDELRNKISKRKEEEKVEEANSKINSELTHEAVDIFKDEKGVFQAAVIKYNPETLEAVVSSVGPTKNKIVAMRFDSDKRDMKTLLKL